MMSETYKCSNCLQTFNYIDNGSWSEEQAAQEFSDLYPEAKDIEVSTFCDDCNTKFCEWFSKLSENEKLQMREEYLGSL